MLKIYLILYISFHIFFYLVQKDTFNVTVIIWKKSHKMNNVTFCIVYKKKLLRWHLFLFFFNGCCNFNFFRVSHLIYNYIYFILKCSVYLLELNWNLFQLWLYQPFVKKKKSLVNWTYIMERMRENPLKVDTCFVILRVDLILQYYFKHEY